MAIFCKMNLETSKNNGGMWGGKGLLGAQKNGQVLRGQFVDNQNMKKRKFGEAPQIVKKSTENAYFLQNEP